MTLEKLPTLPDDVKELLDAERGAPEPVPDHVRAQLAQSFGVNPQVPRVPSEMATKAIARAGRAAIAKTVALLSAGAIAGSVATLALHPTPPPEVRYIEVPRWLERDAGPSAALDAEPPPAAVVSSHPALPPPRAADAPPAPVATDPKLTQERALMETTRAAVARHDGPAALQSIAEHERKFPAGRLTEEREALAVQALVLAGRMDEARARAARFRARYPNGLFLPVVDAALAP